jgi:hypothetical protein
MGGFISTADERAASISADLSPPVIFTHFSAVSA